MTRALGLLVGAALAGCVAPAALPPPGPAPDLRPVPGAPASRPAGRLVSLAPPAARVDDPRGAPVGLELVVRDPATLRPTALVRVIGGRGQVATLAVERGAPRLGDELVAPSPAALEAARRLPAP